MPVVQLAFPLFVINFSAFTDNPKEVVVVVVVDSSVLSLVFMGGGTYNKTSANFSKINCKSSS